MSPPISETTDIWYADVFQFCRLKNIPFPMTRGLRFGAIGRLHRRVLNMASKGETRGCRSIKFKMSPATYSVRSVVGDGTSRTYHRSCKRCPLGHYLTVHSSASYVVSWCPIFPQRAETTTLGEFGDRAFIMPKSWSRPHSSSNDKTLPVGWHRCCKASL